MKLIFIISSVLFFLFSCSNRENNDLFKVERDIHSRISNTHKIIEVYNDSSSIYSSEPVEAYIVDSNGNNVLNRSYDLIIEKKYPFFFYTIQNNKIGIIDGELNTVVEPIFSAIDYLNNVRLNNDSVLILMKDSLFGLIHLNGDIKIPFIYDEIKSFDEYYFCKKDFFRTRNGNKWDVLNSKFEIIDTYQNVEDKYFASYSLDMFYSGFAVSKNNKYALVDYEFNEYTKYLYDSISDPFEFQVGDLIYMGFVAKIGEEIFIMKLNGEKLTPAIVCDDLIRTLDNDKFIYKLNSKFGVVDAKGKELISPIYTQITEISSVKNMRDLVLESRYNYAHWAINKSVLFFKNDSIKGVALDGEIIEEYNNFEYYKNLGSQNFAISNDLNKWSIYNVKLKVKSDFIYDDVKIKTFWSNEAEDVLIQTKIKKYYGLINVNGDVLLKNKYLDMKYILVSEDKRKSVLIELTDSNNLTSKYEYVSGK